ncbi:MAG: CpsD/CapB family tyrosine-protein kinase [Alistipes sp.]|nr:CpsD/CapB family tyrosine-protein kinase [Alistipes sp.]
MQEVTINVKKADNRLEESYKNLRTNIQLCGSDNAIILFTSCSPNEGKSSISFNLARSMAEVGKKVLFVDADLRKSVLLGRYRVSGNIKGLTHYLSGQCNLDEIIYATQIDRLHMIFSGVVPPNPAELLDGKLFKAIIREFSRHYDYVIIDTPPLGNVIDAAIIAQVANAAVLVLGAGNISRKFAQMTLEQLKKTNCKVLGAVLNKVDLRENGYYGKYYGKYYGEYYGNYSQKQDGRK